jgi:hypothetical protein
MTVRGPGEGSPARDVRCLCGGLLARWKGGALELKCRRCKRTLLIPQTQIAGLAPRPSDPEGP